MLLGWAGEKHKTAKHTKELQVVKSQREVCEGGQGEQWSGLMGEDMEQEWPCLPNYQVWSQSSWRALGRLFKQSNGVIRMT